MKRKDPTQFRDRFKLYREKGILPYKAGRIDDEVVYRERMKDIARENYQDWGYESAEAAWQDQLNNPTYNYRGYYMDPEYYQNTSGNAAQHWPDKYKTPLHKTFSNESIYHGQKSDKNPYGLRGGMWIEDEFIPAAWQRQVNLPKYADGLTPYNKRDVNTSQALYNPEEDLYSPRYTLPEVTITGTNKRPHTHAPIHLSKNAYKMQTEDLLGAMATGSDIGDALDVGKDLYNQNYTNAGIGAAMFAIPNVVEKPLRGIIKPVSRYLSGADIKKKMIDAARSVDFTKHWDNDTSIRWWLNGEKIPDFKFIYHGRGTNRGKPQDVLRTYSSKDVGLHVTENRKTAERFAENGGVLYQGVDATQYPDAIYPDMQKWYARMWDDELTPTIKYSKSQLRSEIDNPLLTPAGKRDFEGKLALRDIMDNFGLKYDQVKKYSREQLFADRDPIELEAANKKFAQYLRENGVNFRYKNDYEGGGFKYPSALLTDPSSVYWMPTIQYKPSKPFLNPNTTIDWINAVKR